VGVKRHYTGTAGKVENCQVATFLSYATTKRHVLLDRRLYLPEERANDLERREKAKVPADGVFRSKSEQAMEMLEQARQSGVPMRWVAGDEVYGDSTELRDLIARHERWYVLAVRINTPVWTDRPPVVDPEPQERGRPRTKARLAAGAPPATTVKQVVARWPESRWQRLTVAEGEKGLITYDGDSAGSDCGARGRAEAGLHLNTVSDGRRTSSTGCDRSESRHPPPTWAGASVHTRSQGRQVCRVRSGPKRELSQHRGQGHAHPRSGGGCACRDAIRLSSCYSPMILTSTRFHRRPSNSP
jgi:hypothetical protein